MSAFGSSRRHDHYAERPSRPAKPTSSCSSTRSAAATSLGGPRTPAARHAWRAYGTYGSWGNGRMAAATHGPLRQTSEQLGTIAVRIRECGHERQAADAHALTLEDTRRGGSAPLTSTTAARLERRGRGRVTTPDGPLTRRPPVYVLGRQCHGDSGARRIRPSNRRHRIRPSGARHPVFTLADVECGALDCTRNGARDAGGLRLSVARAGRAFVRTASWRPAGPLPCNTGGWAAVLVLHVGLHPCRRRHPAGEGGSARCPSTTRPRQWHGT